MCKSRWVRRSRNGRSRWTEIDKVAMDEHGAPVEVAAEGAVAAAVDGVAAAAADGEAVMAPAGVADGVRMDLGTRQHLVD